MTNSNLTAPTDGVTSPPISLLPDYDQNPAPAPPEPATPDAAAPGLDDGAVRRIEIQSILGPLSVDQIREFVANNPFFVNELTTALHETGNSGFLQVLNQLQSLGLLQPDIAAWVSERDAEHQAAVAAAPDKEGPIAAALAGKSPDEIRQYLADNSSFADELVDEFDRSNSLLPLRILGQLDELALLSSNVSVWLKKATETMNAPRVMGWNTPTGPRDSVRSSRRWRTVCGRWIRTHSPPSPPRTWNTCKACWKWPSKPGAKPSPRRWPLSEIVDSCPDG